MTAIPNSTHAVVLRTIPLRESDVVAHLLCRGLGRVGAIARGARKSTRRFGGGLEPFALLQVELQQRRGADLLELRGAEVIDAHMALRTDLARLAHAGYATELTRELLHDHEPHDPLMDLLLEFFAALERSGPRSLLLRAFELHALSAAGFAPQLDSCARCGEAISGEMGFDPESGGVLCSRCRPNASLRLDEAARRLLVALQRGGLTAAEAAGEEGLPLNQVARALRAFVDRHVRTQLQSLAFIRSVGAPE